ncbi:MAG: gamma-glutamyl-gamma-aminobutyrate hydrolase family protein [Chitinophagaceae bacterium]|nr:gamma-glutamyl-gamma-aminobutyrate hydrolase family protein [Chitinophagaceae bacterium]
MTAQNKIRIGLTYTGTAEKHNNYVNWLVGNDAVEITRLSAADNNLEKVKEMDAVVLSGGVDTHPKNYGSDITDYPNAPTAFQEDRDAFETAVFQLSRQQQLPVLAICRGMQLVNCILGGNLIQDIGPEGNDLHRSESTDEEHDVVILPGTMLRQITRKEKDRANSAHHQCVGKLGEGLKVNAQSEDGIIEGYEWADKKSKPFLLGVQWHPERMYQLNIQSSALSRNIREYFMNAICSNMQHQ